MALKTLLKFHKYAFAWENYLLLGRAVRAARMARRSLGEKQANPHLASSLKAINCMYMPPQEGWRISNPEKILVFADFIINAPKAWGGCVQRSLIAYRLLNGYGFPSRICIGVSRDETNEDGHAWVVRLAEPGKALGERSDPRERFNQVYTSPLPR
jgi:hypothetical protein